MNTLELAYHRSAFPRQGIPLERALAEPALRGTLALLERIHHQAARAATRTRAGRYMEATAR